MGKKKGKRPKSITVELKGEVEATTNTKPTPGAGPSSASNLPKGQSKVGGSLEEISLIDLEYESTLEKLMQKVNDKASFVSFAQAWNNDVEFKMKLLEENFEPVYDEFEKLVASKKLDSNLKKCTGFVRKLKQYTESHKASIEIEVKTLNLSKYLTEIAAAITESRFKIEHVQDAVVICSWIHQRYSEFSPMLVDNYKNAFPKKTDMTSMNLSKMSVDIRALGELVICGVIPKLEGCQILGSVIKNLVSSDHEGLQCFVPMLSFVVGLGDSFCGIQSKKLSNFCKEFGVELLENKTLTVEAKSVFKNLVQEYFDSVSSFILRLHQELQKSELYNRKLLKTKGEIPADRKEAHLGIQAKFDKNYATAIKLADAMNCELPEMISLPADPEEEEERAMLMTESGEMMESVPGIILFEDEDTRAFYQDFKDLKVYLPPVAYRESVQQAAEETQKIEEREKALDDFDDEAEIACLERDTPSPHSFEEEGVISGDSGDQELPPSLRETDDKDGDAPVKATFQEFLDRLPNFCGRNTVDVAALDFAENHNTKANRKKLVHSMFRVPRQRIDLLPYYSRMVAILNPVMPDLGLELCRMLKNDMFFLVRKKHQTFIETKLKIVRFIGELVKFRIFPKSDALHCLKRLLMNFVHHQIDMACALVETCGRVLYRTPDSHRRMKIYLEEMIRKKRVKQLEPRYVCLIDYAISIVLPRENAPKIERKLTAIELYLKPILIENLSKVNYKKAVNILKSLDWDDEWDSSVAVRLLTSPSLVTAQQLKLHAKLLVDLSKVEPDVVGRIIDVLLEEFRRGLEHPIVHLNQRRSSLMAYIAELYYYRLLGSNTMFEIMYMLLSYGLDPPANMNRILLSNYVLQECGEYLVRGKNRTNLKLFVLHLQNYIWAKKIHPVWASRNLPLGVYEPFCEIVPKIFPKMKFAQSYEEAVAALEEVQPNSSEIPEVYKIQMQSIQNATKENSNQLSLAPIYESYEYETYDNCNNYPKRKPVDWIGSGDMQMQHNDFENNQEDEEFIRLFEQMRTEASYNGKQVKSELTIPLQIKKPPQPLLGTGGRGDNNGSGAEANTVPFLLMTRKGNKQNFKTLAFPANSEVVQRIKSNEALEQQEKANVKLRTLAISRIQEAEERQQEVEAVKTSLYSSRLKK